MTRANPISRSNPLGRRTCEDHLGRIDVQAVPDKDKIECADHHRSTTLRENERELREDTDTQVSENIGKTYTLWT